MSRNKRVMVVVSGLIVIALIIIGVILAPPNVDITSSLSPVRSKDYTLTGTTSADNATVTVNGKKASLHGNKFSIDLDLEEGDNDITIVVKDGSKQTTKQVKIHRDVYTYKTVTEVRGVHYSTKTVKSSAYPKGTTQVTTHGQNGKQRLTFRVTYKNGKQDSRDLVKTETILKPVTKVTTIGTYMKPPAPPPPCDPNYSGACVPIASDVDCAGGSGNGPAYVSGPVYVTGYDIYGLDGDGNGVGCQ